ncbi:MAG: hypothetical protein WBQ34_04565 [Candidatus Acidiferrales bacterium]
MKLFPARRRRAISTQQLSGSSDRTPVDQYTDGPGALIKAFSQAENNINPLYENIDACGKRLNPEGGVDLSAIALEGTVLSDVRIVLSDLGRAHQQASANSVLRITVKTAREVRAEVEAAHRAAKELGEWPEPATLEAARDDITCAIKDYATSIDSTLGNDFQRAEAAWSQVREDERILEPLLTRDTALFVQTWSNRGSAERNALARLEEGAGLDREGLDRWVEANKPRRGTRGWVERHPVLTASAVLTIICVFSVGWKDPMNFVFAAAVFAFVGMFALGAELVRTEEMLDALKTRAEAEIEQRVENIRAQRYYIRKLSKRCRENRGAPD